MRLNQDTGEIENTMLIVVGVGLLEVIVHLVDHQLGVVIRLQSVLVVTLLVALIDVDNLPLDILDIEIGRLLVLHILHMEDGLHHQVSRLPMNRTSLHTHLARLVCLHLG